MLVNGKPQESIKLNDRALAYGDGAFETILLHKGKTILLEEHLQRLQQACNKLSISCDFEQLKSEIQSLQEIFEDYGVLKIILSRGEGGRGYRFHRSIKANRIITLHQLPDNSGFDNDNGVEVFVCEQRLSRQAQLAGLKHLNRLEQVLASREWPDDNMFEGIMLDTNDNVIEGTRCNLFYVKKAKLITPSLLECGVDGIMRQQLIKNLPIQVELRNNISLQDLLQADEIFLCNSVTGIWPVSSLCYDENKQQYEVGEYTFLAKNIFKEILEKDVESQANSMA